jgi:hypothetical protein
MFAISTFSIMRLANQREFVLENRLFPNNNECHQYLMRVTPTEPKP